MTAHAVTYAPFDRQAQPQGEIVRPAPAGTGQTPMYPAMPHTEEGKTSSN